MTAAIAPHVVRNALRDQWDEALTLRAGRDEYFRFNEFGPDGGYSAKWVDFKFGPIPFPFPNTRARVDAVKYHDLHHVMTGYQTSFLGELEISAWELGSGCADKSAAWILNLGGMGAGMLLSPRRILASFVRGRRSRNLYRYTFDDRLLARTIGEVRRELGLDVEPGRATAGDLALAALFTALGLLVGTLTLWLLLPLAPIGYLAGKLLRR